MRDFSLLFRAYASDLATQGRSPTQPIFNWFESGSYQIVSEAPDVLTIAAFDAGNLSNSVDYEYSRFLFASIETAFVFLEKERPSRVGGWSLVKRYYSAFYAAHSLLNAVGCFVIYLDGDRARMINKWVGLRGGSGTLGAGNYIVEIDRDLRSHQLTVSQIRSSGGTHQALWKVFKQKLSTLIGRAVGDGMIGASDHVARWSELEAILSHTRSADGGWLSNFRNAVNYRFEHNAWYPAANPSTLANPVNVRALQNSSVRLDFDIEGNSAAAFTAACTFLVAVAVDLAKHLSGPRDADAKGFQLRFKSLLATSEANHAY